MTVWSIYVFKPLVDDYFNQGEKEFYSFYRELEGDRILLDNNDNPEIYYPNSINIYEKMPKNIFYNNKSFLKEDVTLTPSIFNNMLFSLGNEISIKVTNFFNSSEEVKDNGYRKNELNRKKQIIELIKDYLFDNEIMQQIFGRYENNKIQKKLKDYFDEYTSYITTNNSINDNYIKDFNNYFINFYYLYLWINYLRCIMFKQNIKYSVNIKNTKILETLIKSILDYLYERINYKDKNSNYYTPLLLSEYEKYNYEKMNTDETKNNDNLIYNPINIFKDDQKIIDDIKDKLYPSIDLDYSNDLYLFNTNGKKEEYPYFVEEKENFERFKECSEKLSESDIDKSEYLKNISNIKNENKFKFTINSFYELFLYSNGQETPDSIKKNSDFFKENCILPPELFIEIPQIFELAFYDSDDNVKIKKEEMQIDIVISEKAKNLEVKFKPDENSEILLLKRIFKENEKEPLLKKIIINNNNTDHRIITPKEGLKIIFNLKEEFKERGIVKSIGNMFKSRNRRVSPSSLIPGGKNKKKLKRRTIKNKRKQSKKKIINNNSRKVRKKKKN